MNKIIVDGDACPVKIEIARTAADFRFPVLIVASYDHYIQPIEGVEVVQVDRHDQAVDLYIANALQMDDVLITQDLGLAAIGLSKKAIIITPRGQRVEERTIDFLLESRHVQAKNRRRRIYAKGPRAFTDKDRTYFQQKLSKVLQSLQESP